MRIFRGVTADGQQVQLTPTQVRFVAWLLDPADRECPITHRGSGWTTAVVTAAAYERAGYENNGPYGRDVAAKLLRWLAEEDENDD